MSKAKSDYYTKLVSDTKTNPKKLWNSINQLLHGKKTSPLPDCSDTYTLANSFVNFLRMRAVFQNGQNGQVLDDNVKPNYTPPPILSFQPLTEEDVRKLMSKSST